jgi:sulfite exporter TauE/SafE
VRLVVLIIVSSSSSPMSLTARRQGLCIFRVINIIRLLTYVLEGEIAGGHGSSRLRSHLRAGVRTRHPIQGGGRKGV